MTGTGRFEGARLIIPVPDYTCDDGTVARVLGGPPLQEQLRNLTFSHHVDSDILIDSLGGVWLREGAVAPSPAPQAPASSAPRASGDLAPPISGAMWPQSSLDEVRQAQRLADAGDPAYTWQVDPMLAAYAGGTAAESPLGSEIFERFAREELGWEESSGFAIMGYVENGGIEGVKFIRCAPGRTNPLYPTAYPDMPPEIRGCAPTTDDGRFETVRFDVAQPAGRGGPSGVWVVSDWRMLTPALPGSTFEHLYPDFDQRQVEQLAPPSNAEVTELLQAFLGARVDGEGAEQYLHRHEAEEPLSPDDEVPLLYATTGETAYERSEIERVQGPVWPTGWIEFKVRLFAEDGTVVEQSFVAVRQEDGRLGLVYGSQTGDTRISTTENGQAVPVPYRFLDGEVTFAAAPPWGDTVLEPTWTILGGVGRGSASQFTMFMMVADPLTGTGCEAGPAPADAEALVRSIRSNPDLETTAPVAASVGGIDALRIDVLAPGQLEVGDCAPMVLEHLYLGQDDRAILYLLDLPEGLSARILAIAIAAADSEFELVVEAAGPILDSFEVHAP